MCAMSMIMGHYSDKWERHPLRRPNVPWGTGPSPISDAELAEFRELLDKARQYDRDNNQPDCEMDEKRQKVKRLADELGVTVSFIDSVADDRGTR